LARRLGVSEELQELKTALATFPDDISQLDLRHVQLAVMLANSTNATDTFLTQSCQLFDPSLGKEKISQDTARALLINHVFLSLKVPKKITVVKPNIEVSLLLLTRTYDYR
jgi:hypothetical protein